MKKVLKIFGIILIIIIVIIAGLIGYFAINMKIMQKTILKNAEQINEVDLSSIDDGVYEGSFSSFVVSVDLKVEVKDNKIIKIDIIKQSSGQGYQGRQVIDRILNKQSLKVDASTGATGSSYCILIALDRALNKK